MLKITRQPESGRSMLEIIGVLAIMAIMSAGAFVMIRNAMATQRRNTVMDDFSKIVTGVRTLFADHDDLSELKDKGADVMVAMSIDSDGPYAGSVYEVNINTNDSTNQTFVVTIKNLPTKDCVVLSQKSWQNSVSPYKNSNCNTGTRYVSVYYEK